MKTRAPVMARVPFSLVNSAAPRSKDNFRPQPPPRQTPADLCITTRRRKNPTYRGGPPERAKYVEQSHKSEIPPRPVSAPPHARGGLNCRAGRSGAVCNRPQHKIHARARGQPQSICSPKLPSRASREIRRAARGLSVVRPGSCGLSLRSPGKTWTPKNENPTYRGNALF